MNYRTSIELLIFSTHCFVVFNVHYKAYVQDKSSKPDVLQFHVY